MQPPGRRGGADWRPILWCVGLAALTGWGPAAAWAQAGGAASNAAAMKSTCLTDYRAHCVGNDPAPPIAAACLAQFYINLSKNCQAALDAYNAPPSDTPNDTGGDAGQE